MIKSKLDKLLADWATSIICPNTLEPITPYEEKAIKNLIANGRYLIEKFVDDNSS